MKFNEIKTEEKTRLDPKCWTGKKIGNPKTKLKGGVRVNNCVPAESVEEGLNEFEMPAGQATGAETDTPTPGNFSVVIVGQVPRDMTAINVWKALEAIFPRDYPAKSFQDYAAQLGQSPQRRVLNSLSRSGQAVAKSGIASRDMAETFAAKFAKFKVPAEVEGGMNEEQMTEQARGVDAKGRTQQQWMQAVKQKFPDAKIMQSKMIDGPCQAMLSDGRKLSWNKVEQGVAEGAPELLKKEMPLHRHAEKLLAQNGVSKDDPDYNHHLGNTIKHLRQFGNIDLINKQGVAEGTNDYFKRRKDEEDRIAGTKAPAKRTPRQTDYEKKRKEQGLAEGSHEDAVARQVAHNERMSGDTPPIDLGLRAVGEWAKVGAYGNPNKSAWLTIAKYGVRNNRFNNSVDGVMSAIGDFPDLEDEVYDMYDINQDEVDALYHAYETVHDQWEQTQGMAEDYSSEYDDESGMAYGSLLTAKRAVDGLMDTIEPGDNLPEWCQEKISLAEDYLVTVWDYIQSEKQQGMDPEIEEMYEAIEDLVEEMAAKNSVSTDLVWESFEAMSDRMLYETAAWRRKEGKSKKGGLNAKGVASYRRENPGSKLQTAVTTKPSKLKPGSKAAKRRKSFCARMGGVKGPMKKPNGDPTRKTLALRKWNC